MAIETQPQIQGRIWVASGNGSTYAMAIETLIPGHLGMLPTPVETAVPTRWRLKPTPASSENSLNDKVETAVPTRWRLKQYRATIGKWLARSGNGSTYAMAIET